MNQYDTLEWELQGAIGVIWLNRSEVRNAFNDLMISELYDCLNKLECLPDVRVVVLAARGPVFCAGADLNHMKKMAYFNFEQNIEDSHKLALLLLKLHSLNKPTLARVHGHAFAGGMGLVAACDIGVASFDAEFCLSEIKLGLIPATISPYIIKAMGCRVARRYMMSGERFSAAEAYRTGLIHEIAPADKLDEKVDDLLTHLIYGGPSAHTATKELISQVELQPIGESLALSTAESIARIRASKEGREGITSFIEKRVPDWVLKE